MEKKLDVTKYVDLCDKNKHNQNIWIYKIVSLFTTFTCNRQRGNRQTGILVTPQIQWYFFLVYLVFTGC